MIVGHTPQSNGITNYCRKYSESLWAIDVGLSRYLIQNNIVNI